MGELLHFNLKRAAGAPGPYVDSATGHAAFEAIVQFDGPGAATWLVWKHRRQLHAHGVVQFAIPQGCQLPNYMRVIFETLKRRRKTWEVTVVGPLRNRAYRVRWLRWGDYRRASAALLP